MYPPLVGAARSRAYVVLPGGVPIPQALLPGPEKLGCICRFVGAAGSWPTWYSHGVFLTPGGLGRTGGTRMHPPMCASGWMVCIRGPPPGHPYPPSVPGGTGGTRVYRPRCGRDCDLAYTWFSHGASLSPERPTHDRRDSGVSAASWDRLDCVHTWFCHRASLSPKLPRTGGIRVYPWLCGSGWILCIPDSPTGRPYPPSGLGKTRGTPMHPSLCGRGWDVAHTGFSHGASLSPGRRRHDRRESGA